MTYPIFAYGNPVLRKKAIAIEKGTDVKALTKDMLATMDRVRGVGLASPQIGKSIRMFTVNFNPCFKKKDSDPEGKKVLINPVLKIDKSIGSNSAEEGCLSIPDILIEVPRYDRVVISYFDARWQLHEDEWTGLPARVIQHEYDHLEGKLHIDYASPLRKRMIQSKLAKISKGQIDVSYEMRFPS